MNDDLPTAYYPLSVLDSIMLEQKRSEDAVNHPKHYAGNGVEVIDAIEAWGLGFNLGNVVKYVSRADLKGSALEDLKKAQWYLEREIARRQP